MKKLISIIILITFLTSNLAYGYDARGVSGRVEKSHLRTQQTADNDSATAGLAGAIASGNAAQAAGLINPDSVSGVIFIDDMILAQGPMAQRLFEQALNAGIVCARESNWSKRPFRKAGVYTIPKQHRHYHWIIFGGRLNDCIVRQVADIFHKVAKGPGDTTTDITLPLRAISEWGMGENVKEYLPNKLSAYLLGVNEPGDTIRRQEVIDLYTHSWLFLTEVSGRWKPIFLTTDMMITVTKDGKELCSVGSGTKQIRINFLTEIGETIFQPSATRADAGAAGEGEANLAGEAQQVDDVLSPEDLALPLHEQMDKVRKALRPVLQRVMDDEIGIEFFMGRVISLFSAVNTVNLEFSPEERIERINAEVRGVRKRCAVLEEKRMSGEIGSLEDRFNPRHFTKKIVRISDDPRIGWDKTRATAFCVAKIDDCYILLTASHIIDGIDSNIVKLSEILSPGRKIGNAKVVLKFKTAHPGSFNDVAVLAIRESDIDTMMFVEPFRFEPIPLAGPIEGEIAVMASSNVTSSGGIVVLALEFGNPILLGCKDKDGDSGSPHMVERKGEIFSTAVHVGHRPPLGTSFTPMIINGMLAALNGETSDFAVISQDDGLKEAVRMFLENLKITLGSRVDAGTAAAKGEANLAGEAKDEADADAAGVARALGDVVKLQTATGERFELRAINPDSGRNKYSIWLYNERTKRSREIKYSHLYFYEDGYAVCIADFNVDRNRYKYTSRGIGRAILRYLANYARTRGKILKLISTDNYGLMRLCYGQFGRRTTYRNRKTEEIKHFNEIDWLRDFGPIEMDFGWPVKDTALYAVKEGSDELECVSKGIAPLSKLDRFVQQIRVRNVNARVQVEWRKPRKPPRPIYYQVRLDQVFDIMIPLEALEVAAGRADAGAVGEAQATGTVVDGVTISVSSDCRFGKDILSEIEKQGWIRQLKQKYNGLKAIVISQSKKGQGASEEYDTKAEILEVYISANKKPKAIEQFRKLTEIKRAEAGPASRQPPPTIAALPGIPTAMIKLAEVYQSEEDLFPDGFRKLHQEEIWRRLRLLPSNSKVLELGIGEGNTLRFLEPSQIRMLTGLDRRVDFLETLKRRYPEVTALNCDWKDIKADDASFDACIGINSMHYAMTREELQQMLRQIDRKLKYVNGKKRILHLFYTCLNASSWIRYWSGSGDLSSMETAWTNYQQALIEYLVNLGYEAEIKPVSVSTTKALSELNDVQRAWLEVYPPENGKSPNTIILASNGGIVVEHREDIDEGYFVEEVNCYILIAEKRQPVGVATATGEVRDRSDAALLNAVKQKLGIQALAAVVVAEDAGAIKELLITHWGFDEEMVLTAADPDSAERQKEKLQASHPDVEIRFIIIHRTANQLTISLDGFSPRICDPVEDVNSAIRSYLESV